MVLDQRLSEGWMYFLASEKEHCVCPSQFQFFNIFIHHVSHKSKYTIRHGLLSMYILSKSLGMVDKI